MSKTDIVERLRKCGPDWIVRYGGHIVPYGLGLSAGNRSGAQPTFAHE
jgi:hypothetical protein